MSFLTEHKKPCSPLDPCVNCQMTSILRRGLDRDDFRKFSKLLEDEEKEVETLVAENVEPVPLNTVLADHPAFQALEMYTRNTLRNEGITTVEDLVSRKEMDILLMQRMGRGRLGKISKMLAAMGHRLAE